MKRLTHIDLYEISVASAGVNAGTLLSTQTAKAFGDRLDLDAVGDRLDVLAARDELTGIVVDLKLARMRSLVNSV